MPVVIISVAVCVSLFSVLSREAMESFSFSDAEDLLRRRNQTKARGQRLEVLARRLEAYAFTYRLLDYFARAMVAAVLYMVTVAHFDGSGGWLAFLLAMALFITLVDIVIRPLGEVWAEPLALFLYPAWVGLYALLWLPSQPFRVLSEVVQRVSHRIPETPGEQAEDEIMAAVSLSEATGQIEEQQRDMIEAVLCLRDLTVERVMTPRIEMHACNLEQGTAGALRMARETGHSRLPVYAENRDNIIGVLYVKDLIGHDVEHLPPLDALLRSAVFIPASKKVGELLAEFRRNRVHLAVILDEYGGTAGLITIEDIIEEVFGDIDDEYDPRELPLVRTLADSTLDLDARMKVREVNERFDCNLPEGERYESLGGLLTAMLGSIPAADQSLEVAGVRLTVLEANQRRVIRVRLERIDEDSGDSE